MKKHNTMFKNVTFFMISFITIYMVILGYFVLIEKYYEWKVNTYDLNKDGIFSKDEQTEEQQFWFNHHINDAGLVFLPIYTLFPSFIVSLLLLIIYRIKDKKNNFVRK